MRPAERSIREEKQHRLFQLPERRGARPLPGRFAMLSLDRTRLRMRPRTLVFITLLALCHPSADGQALTNTAPLPATSSRAPSSAATAAAQAPVAALPDDPGQEILPVARPVPAPATGTPVEWQAQRQEWAGNLVTLTGKVVFHYRDYVLRADKVTYNRASTEVEADGHLQLAGGPNDLLVNATHGEMRLDTHTARFYDISGSQGVRTAGRTVVYSTPNPFLFSARVFIQNGEGNYRLVDGSFTNCRIPHPDWRIIAHSIALADGRASTSNSFFEVLDVPVFYLPYLRHATAATGRESGLLIPVVGNDTIRGYTLGEQVYWAINRSMDAVLGMEYFSKRGPAPNGDFRYKGPGLDHAIVRFSALFDRGLQQPTPTGTQTVKQGGVDIASEGSKDFSAYTRLAGTAEYLSSYVYRLVFNDNYSQATSSQVSSDIAFTHARNGFVPSVSLERFQNYAGTTNGDEVRILHLPNVRYDVLDHPLARGRLYWGLGSSLNYLSRSEPSFHARNVGRFDLYPHLVLPLQAGGWNVVAEGALRDTSYTISQNPDLTGAHQGIPTISHDAVHRIDAEASLDIRPPALERDFHLGFAHRELRHVVEPELTYRLIDGIGSEARNVLLFDTTDVVTDTNQAGYSLTQRLYLRRSEQTSCPSDSSQQDSHAGAADRCSNGAREWASWRIMQDFYIDPKFGGALIPGRRNVFESTLGLTGVAFLTSLRSLSPVISRMRFEAVPNLRIQWDLDYDPKRGGIDANNIFAGYSFGHTTIGMGDALLNAVDEATGTTKTTLSTNLVEPYFQIGAQNRVGFNLAVNGGYDFVQRTVQYAGVQAVYNWDCCGLMLGYRRFELGALGAVSRDETEWLYSFTLANFGNVGDIHRGNAIFRDPTLAPAY
jgi:LPS-assembly protein